MSNIEDIEARAAERSKKEPWSSVDIDGNPMEFCTEAEADLDLAIAGWKEERADLEQLRRDEGRRVVAEAERIRELREARADVRKLRG